MDNHRMSAADMLQYCNEALAWDDFGPVDIFFFESVKKILLGECSPFDELSDLDSDFEDFEKPVTGAELATDYDKVGDEFYGIGEGEVIIAEEISDEDIEEEFEAEIFTEGFFVTGLDENNTCDTENDKSESFTVNVD